ncbi:MAG: GNAT family N-acetyltransferase [Bacteroidota bacterium]
MNIIQANTEAHFSQAKTLFKAYQEELAVDLCFQSFNAELESISGIYNPSTGGLFLLEEGNTYFGCAGIKYLSEGVCELKRMYIHPSQRGKGYSQVLIDHCFDLAKTLKYTKMQLDTLPRLKAAIHLYEKNGFEEIMAYYDNPLDGVRYFEKLLITDY